MLVSGAHMYGRAAVHRLPVQPHQRPKNQFERAAECRADCGNYGFLLLVAQSRVISAIEGKGRFRALIGTDSRWRWA